MIADNKGNNSYLLDILHRSLFDGQNLDFVKILKIAALSLLDLLHKFKWRFLKKGSSKDFETWPS